MTSADLDHNDKLLAAGKKEKLEWVTPKISLMDAGDTDWRKPWWSYEVNVGGQSRDVQWGPS